MTETVSIAVRQERMRTALQARSHTYEDLQAISGLHKSTVRRWVADMRSCEPKRIYVSGWDDDERGRPVVTKLRWGNKPDVPRPGTDPQGAAKRMKRMRQRRKQEAAAC